VEAAREDGPHQGLDVLAAGPAGEAAGDEDRLVRVANADAAQLCHGGRDRVAPGVDGSSWQGQRGRLDDDRHPAPLRHERFERSSRERKSEGVADGRSNVGDRSFRRRRSDDHGIVGRVDDHEVRAREERDARHRYIVDGTTDTKTP
jgi:hypothetical protein